MCVIAIASLSMEMTLLMREKGRGTFDMVLLILSFVCSKVEGCVCVYII